MPPDQLEASLAIIDRLGGPNAEEVSDRDVVRRIKLSVHECGYASAVGLTESKISAIALPVVAPDRRVAGAVNIVFFRSGMTPEQAAARHLAQLRTCVDKIEQALSDWQGSKDVADP